MPDSARPDSAPSRRQVLGWLTAGAAATGFPLVGTRAAHAIAAAAPLTVWLPSPADKVRRDRAFPGTSPQKVSLAAARNEYESGQFVVRTTSGTTLLGVSAGELTGPGGAKISGIEVFERRYIHVSKTWPESQPNYQPGPYPDALVPLAPSRTLTVSTGANQGVWFTVRIPKGQPAGRYTGSITLTGGTTPVSVPVELDVWGFELPDAPSTTTAAAIWYQQVARTHGLAHTDPRHEPMMAKYYEFQLRYRLTSDDPPGPYRPQPAPNGLEPGPGLEPEPAQFLASADKYLRDPRVGRFRIPLYARGNNSVGYQFEADKVRTVVSGLRDRGLLDRGYFYFADEPLDATAYNHVRKFFADVSAVAPDVDHILTLTDPPNQDLLDFVRGWCFVITAPKPELPGIVETLKARGDTVWWYNAYRHVYPLPSMFLPDSSVGARLIPWIQHNLGIEGWLFWSTTVFGTWTGNGYVTGDRWTDPFPLPGADAGDGYLMYPGNAVGIDGPVPSIRLDNLRDGFEDLEYLALYDRRSAELATGWGLPVPDQGLQSYHDVLHTWVSPYRDDPTLFHHIRRQVGAEVAQLFGPAPALVRISKPRAYGVVVELLTGRNNAVTIGGVASTAVQTTATGARHRVVLELPAGRRDITISVAGNTFTRTVDVGPVAVPHEIIINSFETEADVARLVTQEASASLSGLHPTTGKRSAKLVFNANAANPDWSGVYFYTLRENRPDTSIGRNDWSKLDGIAFDIYSESDEVAVIYCDFHDPVHLDNANPFYLTPGKQQRVVIPFTQLVSDLPRITSIKLRTPRRAKPLTVYVDNVRFLRTATDLPVPGKWARLDTERRITFQTVKANGDILHATQTSAGWQHVRLAAGVSGQVAGLVDPAQRMNLFSLTSTGRLMWSRQEQTWQHRVIEPPAALTGTPAAVLDVAGRITYFARTADGSLVRGRQVAPGSADWSHAFVTDRSAQRLKVSGDPASIQDPSGRLTYFVRSPVGELVHGWETEPGNNQWSVDIIRQGGTGAAVTFDGRPSVAQDISGRLTFHARQASGALVTGWQSTPGSGPWRWDHLPLGTLSLAGDPVSGLDPSGKQVCFARTTDGRIYHGWSRYPGNGPWELTVLGTGGITGDGALVQAADGVLHYFARRSTGVLSHWWQDAPGQGPWLVTDLAWEA